MPLETATYITDLVTSNPAHSDGMNNDDAHMRLVKATLKNTFPNFTSAAVNSTQAQLDAAAALVTNGNTVLPDTGAHFKTNTTDGIENPSAGQVTIVATNGTAKQTVATFKGSDKSLSVAGPLSATGPITGPGVVPLGGTLLWWDDTLPTDGGTWAWANGQVVASANTVCPTLLTRWGNKFGGNGTTTMGVPDLRETVPLGKSTMGATTARGLITNWASSFLTLLNNVIGEAQHVIASSEMPSHRHVVVLSDPGHAHTYQHQGGSVRQDGTSAFTVLPTTITDTTSTSTTGINIGDGAGNLNVTALTGGGAAHNNVQPSTVCNYIIRIA